jgi:hypothetical protein
MAHARSCCLSQVDLAAEIERSVFNALQQAHTRASDKVGKILNQAVIHHVDIELRKVSCYVVALFIVL